MQTFLCWMEFHEDEIVIYPASSTLCLIITSQGGFTFGLIQQVSEQFLLKISLLYGLKTFLIKNFQPDPQFD